ncbi:hypothetical protein HK100_008352 [Physocladia obscura]|uniref:Uncharacterized protein n=1 Tax=Physocladia obscura TaxID=109957 RepID=A0AAD5SND9_9FUNG|nr:hypothetical protein HK100_008352 [Physocladia obscura]
MQANLHQFISHSPTRIEQLSSTLVEAAELQPLLVTDTTDLDNSAESGENYVADDNYSDVNGNNKKISTNYELDSDSDSDHTPLSVLHSRRTSTSCASVPLTGSISRTMSGTNATFLCPDCQLYTAHHPNSVCFFCKTPPATIAQVSEPLSFSLASLATMKQRENSATGSIINMQSISSRNNHAPSLLAGAKAIANMPVVGKVRTSAASRIFLEKAAKEEEEEEGKKVKTRAASQVAEVRVNFLNDLDKDAGICGDGVFSHSEAQRHARQQIENKNTAIDSKINALWGNVCHSTVETNEMDVNADDAPLSSFQLLPPKLRKKDYTLGSSGEIAEDGGKYSYARPGTLLHLVPKMIEADRTSRPIDGRHGRPLISLDVAVKSHAEHEKVCYSLAYKTMIKVQEEKSAEAEKQKNAIKREKCEKCDGKGFKHPSTAKVHNQAATVECKHCRTCGTCFGTGLLIDITACIDCQSLGYIHPNEPYACRNTGPCQSCIACKTCRGTGITQKSNTNGPRLSVQSLTASVASLALKKKMFSGSTINLRKHRSNSAGSGVVISRPLDFRRLAAGRLAGNKATIITDQTQQQITMMERNKSTSSGTESISMILEEATSLESSAAILELPRDILAPLLKEQENFDSSLSESELEEEEESDVDGQSNESESENSSREKEFQLVESVDEALAKAMQEKEMGSGVTLPDETTDNISGSNPTILTSQ